MAYKYRKTFKKGPVNITFSKSGVSSSVGNKYIRAGINPKGKAHITTKIPGTGLSNTTQIGSSYKNSSSYSSLSSSSSTHTNSSSDNKPELMSRGMKISFIAIFAVLILIFLFFIPLVNLFA